MIALLFALVWPAVAVGVGVVIGRGIAEADRHEQGKPGNKTPAPSRMEAWL